MVSVILDRLKGIMEKVENAEDFKKAAPKLDTLLDDPDIDTQCSDYFYLTDLVLSAHRMLSMVDSENRREHLLRQREVHERLLQNPYSYIYPHSRIDSEFEIEHIDLYLKGVERRVEPKVAEEVEQDA